MAEQKRRSTQGVEKDGIKITQGPGVRKSVWLLALAMALVGLAIFVVIRPALRKLTAAPQTTDLAAKAPARRATEAPRKRSQERIPTKVPMARLPEAAPAPQPEKVTAGPQSTLTPDSEAAEQDTAETNEADQPTGLAVFPPPGTKPIKRGIIVPDGVELPPGYVRHYQTTDDGRQLPPILMFHPDYHPVDEDGNPIPLPEDRVVPPGMAPPDIPIQMLEVPEEGAPVTGGPAQGRRAPER